MRAVGIIAEYNPFHNGHLLHINETRRIVKDAVIIAVMSGNFVQRGDFALMGKFARAEAAVRCGVDLVIEMPVPFAVASAERFASAGIALLDACGIVDIISFGSEAGDTAPLYDTARYLSSSEFDIAVSGELQSGVSYAAARQAACDKELGKTAASVLKTPNNTLGIEYIRAILRSNSSMQVMTVLREGAAHDAQNAVRGTASASTIREHVLRGENVSELIPNESHMVLLRELERGAAPVSIAAADMMMMSHLRRLATIDFARLPDVSEGLEHRIASAVQKSVSVAEVADRVKTKRYAHSRIRRILLNAYLGVTADLASLPPPYLRVLACSGRGREALRRMKRAATLPVITKTAAVSTLGETARRIFAAECLAGGLYALARPSSALHVAGEDFTVSPHIVT